MKKDLLRTAAFLALCATTHAGVVRPAPNFGIEGVAHGSSLRSFRGQPVVLIITRNSRTNQFLSQLFRLKDLYSQFATENVLFVAAIEEGEPKVPSDIPFVIAENPAQVAGDYGVSGRFAIAVIGVDGNLDMITTKVVPGPRVKDMIFNNFENQKAARKQPNL